MRVPLGHLSSVVVDNRTRNTENRIPFLSTVTRKTDIFTLRPIYYLICWLRHRIPPVPVRDGEEPSKENRTLRMNMLDVKQGLPWADAGGPARGWAGPRRSTRHGPSLSYLVGSGPAQPIRFSDNTPRPGPAWQYFRGWAAARPGLSKFNFSRPGPARPMTFAAGLMRQGLCMGRSAIYVALWADPRI